MSTPLVDPSLAQASLTEQQMQSMQREAEASRRALNSGAPASKEKKLRQACEGFEAVFIQKMWEGMRASLPKEGLLHSREEQFWQGMYDQELGKSLASAGGVGLADMMMTQLSRNLEDASAVAASRNGRVPLDIPPVPLLPAAAARQAKATSGTGLYEGEAGQPAAPAPAQAAAPAAAESAAAESAAARTPPLAAANVPNPTPPQVMGPLKEFAASLGVAPPDTGGGQIAATVAQADPAGPVPEANPVVPGVHVFPAGQQPPQSLDELASALAAQASRESGGPVRVITTRQVNTPTRSQPARVQRVVRQNRTSPPVAAGSPVTGRGNLAPVAQEQRIARSAPPASPATAAASGPAAAPSVPDAPVSLAAGPAGAPAGPTALATSVQGLGSGSELASNTAATQGIPPAGRAGTGRE